MAAEEDYATLANIDSLEFTETTVEDGTTVRLDGTWSLPDNPVTPAGFVVDLPPELQGRVDVFLLTAPDGATIGNCEVTATVIECTFVDAYLAENPLNLRGDFYFYVTVLTDVTEDTEVTFEFGDVDATVTVTPNGGLCPDCEFDGRDGDKIGTIFYDRGVIVWTVRLPAPPEGAVGGEQMIVEDFLGPNQEMVTETGGKTYPYVDATTELVNGVPGGWNAISTDSFVVDGDKVSWTAEAGHWYVVRYASQITDEGASGSYSNQAEIAVGTEEPIRVEHEIVYQGSGGSGIGENVGAFSVTKQLDGDTENLGSLEFQGSYTVTLPDNAGTESGEFTVNAGETWNSDVFPRGSTVELTEFLPTDPANIEWDAPDFSQNSFALVGGERIAVQLTNHATARLGSFEIQKQVTGDAASLLPEDTVFEVEYAYEAGHGFPAGEGKIDVPASGETVTVPDIPVSAVVQLAEIEPFEIEGATWQAPEFSQNVFTVGSDENVSIVLTNTLTLVPEEPVEPGEPEVPTVPEVPTEPQTPEQPAEPQSPEKPALVNTGADTGILILAAGMLALVGLALIARRSRV